MSKHNTILLSQTFEVVGTKYRQIIWPHVSIGLDIHKALEKHNWIKQIALESCAISQHFVLKILAIV